MYTNIYMCMDYLQFKQTCTKQRKPVAGFCLRWQLYSPVPEVNLGSLVQSSQWYPSSRTSTARHAGFSSHKDLHCATVDTLTDVKSTFFTPASVLDFKRQAPGLITA